MRNCSFSSLPCVWSPSKVTASLNVTVMLIQSPILYLPSWPAGGVDVMAMEETVGALAWADSTGSRIAATITNGTLARLRQTPRAQSARDEAAEGRGTRRAPGTQAAGMTLPPAETRAAHGVSLARAGSLRIGTNGGRWAAGPLGRWAAGPLGRWAAGPLGRWAAGPLGPLGRWAAGPLGRWAAGPLGRWAAGPLGRWAAGPLGRWAAGPLGRWAAGPLGRWAAGPLGRWAAGPLGRWAAGPLGRWAAGPLGRWAAGPLGRWAAGPLGRWAAGPLGRWAAGPLGRWAIISAAGFPEVKKKPVLVSPLGIVRHARSPN